MKERAKAHSFYKWANAPTRLGMILTHGYGE